MKIKLINNFLANIFQPGDSSITPPMGEEFKVSNTDQ